MRRDAPVHTDIVLVGGGHAHVAVLKSFGMRPVPGVRLSLISPDSQTPYSGMLPGYLAGHYGLEEANIDLRPLCRFAGARFYRAAATGIDLDRREVICAGRPPVPFDFLSLDIGSAPDTSEIDGAEHALPVKPVDAFLDAWQAVEEAALANEGPFRLTVIGAGAGGVESALALTHRLGERLEKAGQRRDRLQVAVVSKSDLPLDTHGRGTRRRMAAALKRFDIDFHGGRAVTRLTEDQVICAGGLTLETDAAVLVTPGAPASWLQKTGLSLTDRGFIRVGRTLQTAGDARIFAAGDVAHFEPRPLPKSGVYAVREGPVLARNLRRAVAGRALKPFRPQRRTLALISMGRKRAVLSYGPLSVEGDWAWRFKDWIDRRWMKKYQDLPDMDASGDDGAGAMRCGGCGAKVPADVLGNVLARLAPATGGADLLVGLEAPDDAAVFRPPAGKAMVQTVDHFRAFIDDPHLFARITANHCLNDIFAVGAAPVSALANVVLPFADDDKMADDLEQILRGALETLGEAGVALIGGHTGEGAEMALGFTINGAIDPDRLLRKAGLRPGDALLVTKPIGTGALLAADMRHDAKGADIDRAIGVMLQSNRQAADVFRAHGATAATDITGFGLAGHLAEMARPAGVTVALRAGLVPVLPGALEAFGNGITSSLQPANRREMRRALGAAGADLDADAPQTAILADPQTAGGLLAGVPGDRADACLAALKSAGYEAAAVIGSAEHAADGAPAIRLIA